MAITISGSKYSSTIASVGTFTITVPGITNFLSADFSYKQRIVALHNPTTNELKGIAYVRKFNNSQSLELETQFYQPWDGATVTQAVGDKVNISKNFADVATTGLTVLYNTVSISDSLTFGTNTNQADTCFYDEDYLVQFGVGAPAASSFPINFQSGVIVFGHLQDYASESITGDVNWTYMGPRGSPTWQTYGPHLNFAHYGGGVRTTRDIYSQLVNANPSPASILLHKFFYDASILANSSFPVPSKAILRNCIGYGQDANILVRWKNGTIEGGYYKMAPSATYYSVFGDDAAGTFTIAAPSNKRLVIGGVGANSNTSGASLWRCGAPSNAQTINFTNVISPVRSATNIGADLPLSVMNYYYSDSITNIVNGSQAAVWRVSDNTIVDSTASTSTVWSPSVLNDKWAGKTRQAGYPITQWKYRIRKYGYNEIANTINASTYPLGNFTSDNVAFSGSVIQVPDAKQTADASTMTGVALNYSTSALTISSSHTIEDVNNYIKYSLRQNLVNDDFTSYAGATLSVGSWAVSGLEYLSTSALFNTIASSGSITTLAAFNNINVVGNVTQATPTNLTGVTITGNLTYNTNTPITVTFTDCDVTGTISNSGSGLVKVVKAGTTPWLTVGSNVNNIASVVVETPGGLALSTYILKNGSTDLGWVATTTNRSLEIQESDTFSIYAIAYGYKAKIATANALDLTSFKFELLPEPFIDTSLSTTTRNFIASKFSTALDAYNRIALSLDTDLRSYDPDEVMNAVQYFITTQGALIAQGVIYGGSIDGVEIINGGISIGTPGFYGKVNDSVTTVGDQGILVPIYVDVLPSVYVADPTYTPVKKNTSNIVLQTAPWTQQTADISAVDKTDIRQGLALEASLALKADQASLILIPTNPLLATDARLNNIDASISSRLPTSSYVAPTTAPSAAENATATLNAINATPPDVNIAKINGEVISGTGVEADPWKPA